MIRNGVAEPSIYFMQLVFPTYKLTNRQFSIFQGIAYNEAELEDFEYIRKSGSRFDMLTGGMINQFFGEPGNYLNFGGGMKIDLTYTDKKKYLYGLNMSFYGNKLKQDYPLTTTREQNTAPPTLLLGLILGKWFERINIQAEISSAIQNVTERLGDSDNDWVQLKGWSPGIVINYPIVLGKEKPMYYYGSPVLLGHSLNVHLGIRAINFSLSEASGMMAEFGISYRMMINSIREYKLKDEFFKQKVRSIIE